MKHMEKVIMVLIEMDGGARVTMVDLGFSVG